MPTGEMRKGGKIRKGLKGCGQIVRIVDVLCVLFIVFSFFPLFAQPGYTNHAGNVVAGWPVALTANEVTLGERSVVRTSIAPRGETYPLSIFPESEQRRMAADFGEPRLPIKVKRAIVGVEKAMARSRLRAEKGLCTKEESDAFCAKSQAALKTYLDRQVESGIITSVERKAIGVKE